MKPLWAFWRCEGLVTPAERIGWFFGEGCVCSDQKQAPWGKHRQGGCSFSFWLLATVVSRGRGGESKEGLGAVGCSWAGSRWSLHDAQPALLPSVLSPDAGSLPSAPPRPPVPPVALAGLCISALLLSPFARTSSGEGPVRYLFCKTPELRAVLG